jgi:hypothetical protein
VSRFDGSCPASKSTASFVTEVDVRSAPCYRD